MDVVVREVGVPIGLVCLVLLLSDDSGDLWRVLERVVGCVCG